MRTDGFVMLSFVKLKILFVLVALGVMIAVWPPARLAAYAVVGRSPQCPMANAVKAADNLKAQIAAKDEILYASKLVEKDSQGYRLYQTPDGPYWIPEGSEYVLPFNLAEMKRKIYGTGARDIQQGDVVLDCGANVGTFARMALNRGASKVIAIEPAPENIECLRRNFKAEIEQGRVVVYPKGVWDKDDFLTMHVDPKNSAADSFLIQRQGSIAVQKLPLTTIDKMVAELKLEKVDYIKMDIEGAEPNALRGGAETIKKFKPRMSLSVYHAPDHPVTIPKIVKETVPSYKIECGPCAEANYAVRPDVLYFYQ
ncbi:MAG: FkbM family methyltransferase [Bryobacteraceae bacterium]|nr:FkbM family methyltransferase [Bryobacteraceae bacterium]